MPLLAQLLTSGLQDPVFVTAAPGDHRHLFILEKPGRIRVFDLDANTLLPEPFLTVPGLVSVNEQGLLGLAFHPQFAQNRRFFVNVTLAGGTAGVTQIQAYQASADFSSGVPASKVVVLQVAQPFTNHNGGWLGFGPQDGFLYASLGDGGSANDPGRRGQDRGVLLGKLLRLNIDADDFAGDPLSNYSIPPSNPFAGQAGARPEIWAYGLRNPWRCSFDVSTGDLWIGDVGQNQREEVNFQPVSSPGGENYGWRLKEGTRVTQLDPVGGAALVDPIHEYNHSQGRVAIIGGYVYRGNAAPELQGRYLFAEHTGFIYMLRVQGSAVVVDDVTDTVFPNGAPATISSFGEDSNGEIYLTDLGGDVFRLTQPN